MDVIAAGTAVPGGLIMAVALAAWMLGRWQSAKAVSALLPPGGSAALEVSAQGVASACLPALSQGATDPDEVTACQHAARAERREITAAARSLAELHAEVTAYRQQEQVLAAALGDGLTLELVADAARQECRYLGLIGQPTCALPHGGHAACNHSAGCAAAAAARAVQPSARPSGLARV